ncbi:hypothetical protein AHAS_Ahas01G0206400 [Arachis hypogaea]
MAHSSTSPSHSKKTQTVHFRATLQTVEIELVAKIRTLHQYNIELSIKRRSYNTQGTLRYYFTHLVYFSHFEIEELGYTVLLRSSKFYCSSCFRSHFTVFNILLVLGFTVILGSRLYFFFIVLRVTVVVVLVLLVTDF